ncbi:MAG TPA: thioesterase domain-containing protein, partial [Bellilinea sp.]|nr:thioesterase domain-containing protein [Bellilinea sp.]
RQALPEPDPFTTTREVEFLAPRNPIEKDLVKIWEKVLRVHPIGVNNDFFELGGNSLLAAQLFASIEERYQKKLPLATLFNAPTIEAQANILLHEDWIANWSSLVPLQSSGKRAPLFLAAPVGGNVLSYHDLVQHIDKDQPVYGLQAVGLDGVQAPQKNVKEIAAHYAEEILNIVPDGPFLLGGSSFGGLVAYEMGQLLHDKGLPVDLVVMFDAYGPNYPKRKPETTRIRRKFLKYLRRFDTHWSNLAATNMEGRWVYLRVKSKKLVNRLSNKIAKRMHHIIHPLPQELRKIQNVHMSAAKKKKKRHQREPRRFGGRFVLFRAAKQPLGIYPDPFLGWDTVAGNQIEVYEAPGHHTSIIYEPRVHVLASKLNEILQEIDTKEFVSS